MKRFAPALLAAVLVIGAAAALAGVGRPGSAHGGTGAPGTVTASGHGAVTLVPDQGTITAGVHTQAASAADAMAQNARRMNDVVAALERAGGKDLQTQQVSLYPQTANDGTITGYAADNSVAATSAIADTGALVDAAVAAGANNVDGPTLSISNRDAAYRDALQKAVADARAKAQALAQAGGFGVGAVASVAEQSAAPVPLVERAAALGADAATPVEPGTQDVTADVTVTFRIT
jgi:uncharacterized protein YggE